MTAPIQYCRLLPVATDFSPYCYVPRVQLQCQTNAVLENKAGNALMSSAMHLWTD